MQFIYLVRPREYAQKYEDVYKIGRTGDYLYNRLDGYSKSTEIILAMPVNDSITLETELKRLFTTLYIKRKDIGDEYFQGDVQLMIQTIVGTLYPDKLYKNIKINTDITKIPCSKYFFEPIIGACEFSDHCDICVKNIDENNTYNYCSHVCHTCISFRKLKQKDTETELKQYYDEHIAPKPNLKNKPHTKITINNVTINNNNNIVKNYVQTKDLFFYIMITSNQENAVERMNYTFTYLMCGFSGKQLFPNEPKHSNARTFPVTAAKYNIITNKEGTPKHVMHGVLRYQRLKNTAMTIKKLEKMGDDNFLIKVYTPNTCNSNKFHFLKEDIDNFLLTVADSENGSNINDFYIDDIN